MLKPLASWLALSLLLASLAFAAQEPDPGPVVTGYIFPQNSVLQPEQISAQGLTRINYAFARIRDGRMVEGFPTDAANLAQITALRQQNPNLRVLISVGGWTWSGGFSEAALTEQSRTVFVESAIEFLRRYNLDGLDVDWEYPGQAGAGHTFRREDKQNYTLLLKELRARLNQEAKKAHRRLYLTVAAGASADYLNFTEMAQVQKYVDAVNLMTYDYYGPASDALTGNHAPLMTDPNDPRQVSADASVQAFEEAGVPASKILLGIPFYGRMWGEVPDRQQGLFQPGRATTSGDLPYSAILATLLNTGFTRYWDASAQVPYLYNAQKRQFVSYEDTESAAAKARYAKAHKLQGVMFWSYLNDPSGALLQAIEQGLHDSTSVPRPAN
ncbi:MAG: glycoside hydrolase family 18 protein [Terracidiphilus sp.]